jgi:hypothetical protein
MHTGFNTQKARKLAQHQGPETEILQISFLLSSGINRVCSKAQECQKSV